jgi:hypothetical protein
MAQVMESILGAIRDRKKRDVAFTVGGMGALLAGTKLPALALFGVGVWGLEKAWRERHPVDGGFEERWRRAIEFYNGTHQDRVNRLLHIAGIPMILGGALGLLLSPSWTPPWWLSAGLFGTGWALNIVGHSVFEKNSPAFAADPLSFVAGPIWDWQQLRGKKAAA